MEYTTTVSLADDAVVSLVDYTEVEVDYEVIHEGFAGSWDSPPEAPEFEVNAVRLDGKPAPQWVVDMVDRDMGKYDSQIQYTIGQDAGLWM